MAHSPPGSQSPAAPLPSLPATTQSPEPAPAPVPFSSLPEIDTRADRANLEARVSYPGLELSRVYTSWRAKERARNKQVSSCWRRFGVLIILAVVLAVTAVVCGIIAGVLLKPGPPSSAAGSSIGDSDRGHDSNPNPNISNPGEVSVETLVTSVSGHLTTIQITHTGSFAPHTRPTDIATPSSLTGDESLRATSETSAKASSSLSSATTTALTSNPPSSLPASKSVIPSLMTTTRRLSITGATSSTSISVPGKSTQPSAGSVTPPSATNTNHVGNTARPATDPHATPKYPVWFGTAEGTNNNSSSSSTGTGGGSSSFKRKIAFVEDGTLNSGCRYTTILDTPDYDENPCGIPVLLADGLEYVWNGCGGVSWVDWRNPASKVAKFQTMNYKGCEWVPQTWSCGEEEGGTGTVSLGFRCNP